MHYSKIVTGFEPLAYFTKVSFLDVWLASEYASEYHIDILSFGMDLTGIWEFVEMFQMSFYKSWGYTRRIRKEQRYYRVTLSPSKQFFIINFNKNSGIKTYVDV